MKLYNNEKKNILCNKRQSDASLLMERWFNFLRQGGTTYYNSLYTFAIHS
jgi:hypothetical protein